MCELENIDPKAISELKEVLKQTQRNLNKNAIAIPPENSPESSALAETLLIQSNTHESRS